MTSDVIPIGTGAARPPEPSMRQLLEQAYFAQKSRLVRYLVVRLGSTAAAEDVAQEAFLRLWQRADQLKDSNLAALLIVTGRNVANDFLRSRQRESRFRQDVVAWECTGSVTDDSPGSDRLLVARQQVALIRKLLDELPTKCRISFVAYKFDGDSYAEIATRLGVTESMVRKYVLRAVAHCATRFEQLEGWE